MGATVAPRVRRRGSTRLAAAFAAAATVALFGALAPRSAQAQLRAPEVTSVEFVGNEAFPADSLKRAIATRETECRSGLFNYFPPLCPLGIDFFLSRSELRERDLPRDRVRLILYYRQRGFRDVVVDTPTVVRTPTQAEVTFRIAEGRPVLASTLSFEGADSLGADLLEDLPIQAGDRLSTLALDATRDTIVQRLNNRGYAYADVFRNAFRPASDPYGADVTFDVVPGPRSTYGDVTVEGLRNLEVGTVLRTVQINRGETYRKEEIDEALRRLYGLEIVRSATVAPDTVTETMDPVIDVNVTIQEGDPFRVRAGGGWSTSECLNFDARWTSRNFTGGGRLLQIRGRIGNLLAAQYRDVLCTESGVGDYALLTGLVSAEFLQPWIFSTRNSLSTSVYAERQSLPGIFVRRAVGAQLALSRALSPQTVLTAFFRPELSKLDADDVLFCTGFLVCTPEDVGSLEGANLLSPIGFAIARDRSDDLLDPRSGYRFFLEFEHAAPWTTSNFRYDRIIAETSRYWPAGGSVLATRVRGGWVGSGGFDDIVSTSGSAGIVHPQKRFYTGGANSVRGFAQSRLGPRVLIANPERLLDLTVDGGACAPEALADLSCAPRPGTTLTPQPTGGTRVLEANAELRFPIVGVLEGVAFTDVGQAWSADQTLRLQDLEFTPGFGIRFPSPVGPIRLDVAYRFRGAEDLSVVTQQIRPFQPGDAETDRIAVEVNADTTVRIPWVSTGELVVLQNPFRFGANDRGFQLHVSIGQAF